MDVMVSYRDHLREVEVALRGFGESQAFTLAAACSERQWPVYERAAVGMPWSKADVLRRTLDAVWEWLLRQRGRPRGFARGCEEAVLEEIKDDVQNAASEVAGAFYGLASIVEGNRTMDVLYAAKANLSFVEAFLADLLDIEPTEKNASAIDSHELMQAEIGRQREDLSALLRGVPMPSVVGEIRAKSAGVSLLGEYWW